MTERDLRKWLGCASAVGAVSASTAMAASTSPFSAALDPAVLSTAGAVTLAVGATIWALQASAGMRSQSARWTRRLSDVETRLEKAESVLSAHPGLVIVWEDDAKSVESGWGAPKILGGPAALASLLALSKADASGPPAHRLLDALGDLPLEEDGPVDKPAKLRERIGELRRHGVTFSGSVVTSEGRAIEADGRIAGGQIALWLTDPAARMAEDGGVLGKLRERAADLHGALSLLERAPMPAWRRGADLSLQWVNRAYAEAVEARTTQEAVQRQLELDPASRALAARARDTRTAVSGEIIVNVAGKRRVLTIVETPMHAAGEAALGGVASDATELDAARADLRRHLEAHARTLDHIPAGVAVYGPGQELVYYNRSFLDLWRLSDGDLAGKPTHAELLDKLNQRGLLAAHADYAAWKAEQLALYTSPDGPAADGGAPDELWHLPSGRTLRVARQRHPLGGVLVLYEDVTEKLELETRYNTLIGVRNATLNTLSEGVAVFGSDGVLHLYNVAFQKMWGLAPASFTPQPHFDAIVARLDDKTIDGAAHWVEIKRRITSFSHEDRQPLRGVEIGLRDGRTFAVQTDPLPDGATLFTSLDITDSRERMKELRERNNWLEAADKVKLKFVNHISYQLRTPLNTILGFSEMLESEMFGPLNERQKEYAGGVLTASNHLLDLINDIIDLAAIEAGQLSLEIGEMDVRKALENAITYAALKAEDTQVRLLLDCPKDIGVVAADERRIKQVLFNLLANAFAFTSPGGEVTLGAAKIDGALRIWVRDTGRGVSPEDQAKAFDWFESRGPGAGAGVGLALVQSFVELHGGWVRMSSREGKGTTVACYLPETGPEQAAAPEQAGNAQGEKPARRARKRSAAE